MAVDLSHSAQDYLEAIFVLSDDAGLTRVKEVADHLDVKKPSVVSAMKTLVKKGLVNHQHYGCLELTPIGKTLAREINHRHRILFRFLHSVLGVNREISEADACRLEHHISPQTLDLLVKFVAFTETFPDQDSSPKWLNYFKNFAETGEPPPCLDEFCGKCELK